MELSERLSKHVYQVYFGNNWTDVHLQKVLKDVSLSEATTKLGSCNTIASLVYHIHYFVRAIDTVLQGKPLEAKDAYSYDVPHFENESAWQQFISSIFEEATQFTKRVAALPEEKWEAIFEQEKYGDYFSNLQGLIEHTHYHLGQIVIIKKTIKDRINHSL